MNGEVGRKSTGEYLSWAAALAGVLLVILGLWGWMERRGAAPEPPPLPEGLGAAGQKGEAVGGR